MIDEKKLIEELEKIFETDEENIDCTLSDFAYHVFDCIKAQPKFGEWIPCSERLPEVEDLHEISIEDSTCYLIQRRCGVMDVAHYIKVYGESYFEAHCIKFNDVIAWMPLPKPYRPEEESE